VLKLLRLGRGQQRHARRVALACSTIFAALTPATADELQTTHNTFGTVGLVEMPSARMAQDGTLLFGASFFDDNQRYILGFQALPWLEADFRYAGLTNFDPHYPVYFDRSFALKARLLQESEYLPAVAVGINDLVGTGIFGGEYLVASKQFGALDATLGMGWGRLASTDLLKNPLTLLSSSFEQRAAAVGAGAFSFGALFHGPHVGLFGGVSWATPLDGLTLTAEYSSDRYIQERTSGNFTPRSQVNFGAAYKLGEATTLNLDWLYGAAIGGSVFFELDPVHEASDQRLGAAPMMPEIRSPEQAMEAVQEMGGLRTISLSVPAGPATTNQLVDALWQADLRDVTPQGDMLAVTVPAGDAGRVCPTIAQLVATYGQIFHSVRVQTSSPAAVATCTVPSLQMVRAAASRQLRTAAIAAIRQDAATQGIDLEAVLLGNSDAAIYYTNNRYEHETDVMNRLTRILMKEAPPEIERFHLIAMGQGLPVREFTVLRSPAEREFDQSDELPIEHLVTAAAPPLNTAELDAATRKNYPQFSWSIFPQLRQEYFDPNNPLGLSVAIDGVASLELFRGFTLSGGLEAIVINDYARRPSDSLLPHVRTDFLNYVTDGRYGIQDLMAEYRFRLAPNVYAAVRGGYLEDMFGGVGGEVLWRPEGQRWALGADLYEVKQRDFNRLFAFQPYHVLTGHVTLYYASPWYGLNFELRAGRYLAGDQGATFQITRRFNTGVEIGAYMTKTNVSAAQFGEGSFDKGIFIRLPISWMLPIHTQVEWMLNLRPVQRDGGQALAGDETLYEKTRGVYYETFGG